MIYIYNITWIMVFHSNFLNFPERKLHQGTCKSFCLIKAVPSATSSFHITSPRLTKTAPRKRPVLDGSEPRKKWWFLMGFDGILW